MREYTTTANQLMLQRKPLTYDTRCKAHSVKDADGHEIGDMFFYEYIRTDVECPEKRPVLFAYNGGPGASCFWLHLGCFAPKRVKTAWVFNGEEEPKEDLLEENPNCPLDVCDIVLIDPIGTGYGAFTSEQAAKASYNPKDDAAVIADFIANWLIEHQRMDSLVYLAAESYGTIRSVFVASALAGGPLLPTAKAKGLRVSGMVMMGSSIIAEPTNLFFSEKGLPFCVQILPTAAAANWYHSKEKSCTLEERMAETESFIENTYLRALYLGSRLPEEEQTVAAQQLSALTGLSAEWLKAHGLQFDSTFFRSQRLSDQGMVMSLYDARFLRRQGTDIDPAADDAALGRLAPYFLKGLRAYEKELGIEERKPYIYTDFNQAMNWTHHADSTPFAHLQAALDRNKNMRVFFANGVYDFCSEAGQAAYAAAKLRAEAGQVLVKNYPSGHMPYIGIESAAMLGEDLRAFLQKGTD